MLSLKLQTNADVKNSKRVYNNDNNNNLKRETESLLIAAQDNAIRTNHIKARIDKTQQNNKCRLCDDRDEMINHIISEGSKLALDILFTFGRISRFRWTVSLTSSKLALMTVSRIRWQCVLYIIKKVRTCRILEFAVLADYKVKRKENGSV